MSYISIFILTMLVSHLVSSAIPRIAIIGGGIGGTSCAYFLRSLFGENLHLDLYEADDVGGRLAVVAFGGKNYDVGGSIIHARNKYMADFLRLFKLSQREQSGDSYFGLYNRNGFVFEESSWRVVTLFKLVKRYHFGIWKLRNHINDMLDNFERIYQYQENGITFYNVTSLLSAMDPRFTEYLHINSRNGFLKVGLSDHTVDELVMATLRTNYGQDLKVHKFVGSVSVAGVSGGLWAFHGGNAQVPEKLLQVSRAHLIRSPVSSVRSLESKEMEITLRSGLNGTTEENRTYDIVIVAAPQTEDMKYRISFENFDRPIKFPGRYHQTVCTLIKGTLRDSYFRDKKKYIDAVLSIDNSVFFNSIARINPVDYRKNSSEVSDVWKIFSQRLLSENELTSLFSKISDKYVKVWLAYPEYDASARHDNFVLDENLYHINAIDWAASSMEMSVIGARNVALLAFQNWRGKQEREPEETTVSRRTRREEL